MADTVPGGKGLVQKGRERLGDLSKLSLKELLGKPLLRFKKDGPFVFVLRIPYYAFLSVSTLALKLAGIYRALSYISRKLFLDPGIFWRKTKRLFDEQGVVGLVRKFRHLSAARPPSERQYRLWLKQHQLSKSLLRGMNAESEKFSYRPKISLIVPVYNTRREWLQELIQSLYEQAYDNWELCIADDASTDPHVKEFFEEYSEKNSKIKIVYRKKSGHISRASNSALKLATGEFIALLDHDDLLTPDALYEVVKLLNKHPDADMIYSDEDKLELDGERADPHFKPDWSPDMFLSCMYTCHLGVYRKKLIDGIGGFRPGYEGAQDYDLVLRLTEETDRIYHIPKILYHWRKVPGSTAVAVKSKPYAIEAGRKAVDDAVKRRGINAEVLARPEITIYRVRRRILGHPKVTIIIPTKDNARLLSRCLRSIEEKTKYKNYEVVIVDNGSERAATKRYLAGLPHRILDFKKPFNFSKINNFAAAKTEGEHLLFLNDDTRVINEGWLEAMLEHSQREGVGAVGAKLLYPNDTIQHAGVILGIGKDGVAGHSHKHFSADFLGYPIMIRNYSAVTAACMMMRRKLFEEIGGFEEALPKAFNDVDLCLRLRSKGYLIVYTPFSRLYHYESASRPLTIRGNEARFMHKRWGRLLQNDPYYNPNLTLEKEDFSLRLVKGK